MTDDEIEALAVRKANLSGLRWDDLNGVEREHYFWLARRELAWRELRPPYPQPRMMPPFKL